MTYEVWQGFAQNESGDVLDTASVTVTLAGTTTKPALFADEDGVGSKTNPFNTDASGFVQFYTAPAIVDIVATKGAFSVTFSNVRIGLPDALQTVATLAELQGLGTGLAAGAKREYQGLQYTLKNDSDYTARIAADNAGVFIETTYSATAAWVAGVKAGLFAEYFGVTGAGDETALLQKALNVAGLSSTPTILKTRLSTIDFSTVTVPSGVYFVGNGTKKFNPSSGLWEGKGTLLTGAVSFTGSSYAGITNCSIDTYTKGTNALAGVSDTTNNINIAFVNTRANNHGHLWEQNSTSNTGSVGGFVTVSDCVHYHGPNGFVTKMRDVKFIRCKSYATTVQGFVVVSDNINGASTYSRAINTLIQDCYAEGGISALRVYARDQFSLSNTNNVQPTDNTRIVNFTHGATTQFVIRFADTADEATAGSYTRVYNDNIYLNAQLKNQTAAAAALYLEQINNIKCDVLFSGNTSNFGLGDNVNQLDRSGFRSNGAFYGTESLIRVNGVNSTQLDLRFGARIMRIQNTVATGISSAIGVTGEDYREVTCIFEDNLTFLSFIPGADLYGRVGDSIDLVYSQGVWAVKRVSSILSDRETTIPHSANLVIDYWDLRTSKVAFFPTDTVSTITLNDKPHLITGNLYYIRFSSGSVAAKTITDWSSDFRFSAAIPKPTTASQITGYVYTFRYVGGVMNVESVCEYDV